MATSRLQENTNQLLKADWLTEEFVKEYVNKNRFKQAKDVISAHGARDFRVVFGGRVGKRMQCSSVAADGEERFLAKATFTKVELTETVCDCVNGDKEHAKCDHVAVMLTVAVLFKLHPKKPPTWLSIVKNEEEEEPLDENKASLLPQWRAHLWVTTQIPEMDAEEGIKNFDETTEEIAGYEDPSNPYSSDSMKIRRRRPMYSFLRKRALVTAATETIPVGTFGRWALDHFTPELIAKILDEKRSLVVSKLTQYISEDELVAFECGMQDEVDNYEERADALEEAAIAAHKKSQHQVPKPDEIEQPEAE